MNMVDRLTMTDAIQKLTNAITRLITAISSKSDSDSENGRLPSSAVLLYLSIFAYFTGFVYAYYFYRHFGISITSTEIPVYYFFLYSFNIVPRYWWAILLGICAFAIIIAFVPFKRNKLLAVLVIVVMPFLCFAALFGFAVDTADSEAIRTRTGITSDVIQLVFRSDAKNSYPPSLIKANDSHSLLLLTQTSDEIVVIRQPDVEGDEFPNANVFQISKDDVLLAIISIPGVKAPKRRLQ